MTRRVKDIAEILRLHTELVFSEPEMEELRERTIRSRLSLPRETILSFFDPDPTKDVMPLLAGITDAGAGHPWARGSRHRVCRSRGDRGESTECAACTRSSGRVTFPIFTATTEFCNVVRCFVRTGTATA